MRTLPLICAIALLSASAAAQVVTAATSPEQVDPRRVRVNEVFEFTLQKSVDYGTHANFEDVELTLDLLSPTGASVSVRGFYYATRANGKSLWKARFAPDELGRWTFAYTWIHVPSATMELGSDSFACIPGSDPGFLRISPTNPRAFQHANGDAFAGLGMNADYLVFDTGARSSAFGTVGVAGEPLETQVSAFREAGFNLIRLRTASGPTLKVCKGDSGIPGDGICETYLPEISITFDEAVQTLKRTGFRILFCMFGNTYLEGELPGQLSNDNRRLIEYCIARWGAYVDLWELTNEREPGFAWEQQAAGHVHQNDPYDHPVTTSYFPDPSYTAWPGNLDFISPHWYETESEFDSDLEMAGMAAAWKSNFGSPRPVVVGEQGNRICGGGGAVIPANVCRSWQSTSRRRARLRLWTAFFEGITVVNWQNAWGTDGNGGLYIGTRGRNETQVLRRFMDEVTRTDTVSTPVSVSSPGILRAYGLVSPGGRLAAAYVHRHASHSGTAQGETIQLTLPAAGTGYWVDPRDGQIVSTVPVSPGLQTLAVPPIQVDLAFFSRSVALNTTPLARVLVSNPQWDGDLDDDGTSDWGPANPPQGRAPLQLSFDAGGSTDWDGGPLSYRWNFGDGTTTSGAMVTHTFTARRNYRVELRVTDDEGEVARQSFMVRAIADPAFNTSNPPIFHEQVPMTAFEGEAIHFWPKAVDREFAGGSWTNTALTPTAFSVTNLPAGATFQALPKAVPNGPNAPREFLWVPDFDQAGSYVVNFAVQDPSGLSATLQVDLTIRDAPTLDGADPSQSGTTNWK